MMRTCVTVIVLFLSTCSVYATIGNSSATIRKGEDTIKLMERYGQNAVDYFLSTGYCWDSTGVRSRVGCYFSPPDLPPGHTYCSLRDSLRVELEHDWPLVRVMLLKYTEEPTGSKPPTLRETSPNRRICDSAFYYYLREDGSRSYIKHWKDIIRLVVARLNM